MKSFTSRQSELNKLAEVAGEIRDFIREREDPIAECRYVAGKLTELVGRVTDNSMQGIDSVTSGLHALRGELQTQGERVRRDLLEYALLSQSTMQSAQIILERLQQRQAVDAPASESTSPTGSRPRQI